MAFFARWMRKWNGTEGGWERKGQRHRTAIQPWQYSRIEAQLHKSNNSQDEKEAKGKLPKSSQTIDIWMDRAFLSLCVLKHKVGALKNLGSPIWSMKWKKGWGWGWSPDWNGCRKWRKMSITSHHITSNHIIASLFSFFTFTYIYSSSSYAIQHQHFTPDHIESKKEARKRKETRMRGWGQEEGENSLLFSILNSLILYFSFKNVSQQ